MKFGKIDFWLHENKYIFPLWSRLIEILDISLNITFKIVFKKPHIFRWLYFGNQSKCQSVKISLLVAEIITYNFFSKSLNSYWWTRNLTFWYSEFIIGVVVSVLSLRSNGHRFESRRCGSRLVCPLERHYISIYDLASRLLGYWWKIQQIKVTVVPEWNILL